MPLESRRGSSLYRNKRLLEAVRELPCAVCGAEDGTVVAAHSNQLLHGKGRGLKAHDWAVAALCFTCHTQIDQGKDFDKQLRKELWDQAFLDTLHLLFDRGTIVVRK